MNGGGSASEESVDGLFKVSVNLTGVTTKNNEQEPLRETYNKMTSNDLSRASSSQRLHLRQQIELVPGLPLDVNGLPVG